MSSLLYFLVFDLPPTSQGYIIFRGYPAVLVSLIGVRVVEYKDVGLEYDVPQDINMKQIIMVGKERFELPKA